MGMSIRVRSLAGAIGALLLVGCGPVGESLAPEVRDPSVTLPGVQASPSLLRACERAAGRWEAATGILITCTEGDRPMYDDPINDWPQAGGATNRNEVRIDVADMQRLGALDLAVTHELGHVLFGGGHPVGGSLMAARPTDPQAPISEADLVWACERRTCTRFEAE